MSEIDAEALAQVRLMLLDRQHRIEKRRQMRPVMDAMGAQIRYLKDEIAPAIVAPSTISSRQLVVSGEKSREEMDAKAAEVAARQEALLSSLRARTAALRRLLEAVS